MPVDPALGPGAQKLAAAVERAAASGRQRTRPTSGILCCSHYRRGSWRAQRVVHRSESRRRLLVTGRGVGKTHACAYDMLQVVMDSPPGSEGAVLAPTLTHAEAAIAKLRELAQAFGVRADDWVSTKRLLRLPGGRSIKVFSADRKEVVRGPSIVILWIEEGAYIHHAAIISSLPAMRTGLSETKTRLLVSTTPAGKNWVWDYWDKGQRGVLALECFRFRSTESPYQDPEDVAFARASMSPERFSQEYLAAFVDNLLLVFPDRDGLFVDSLPLRPKKAAVWLGVDLGKKDFTVCTAMNEWQEAWIAGRWNETTPGFNEGTYWAQTYDRVEQLARDLGATVVVDTGGAGGAAGAVLAEHLRGKGLGVVEVKTSQQGTKAKIVEQAKADVQWKKLKVLRNEHAEQLDYELSKFQGIKRQIHGQEVHVYEGPQVPGEYDDCVISFCLANWGRATAEAPVDPCAGDYTGWSDGLEVEEGPPTAPSGPAGDFGDWSP